MTTEREGDPLVRLHGIVRRFGPVTALDHAKLDLRAGEIHGVLGENGAGKSTLLNVLGGMLQPDAGTISWEGRPVEIQTPRFAWSLGIGLVHQHFKLVPRLTVLENLALGRRDARAAWRLGWSELRATATRWMDRTGLSVPLDSHVEELGVGDRQRVEILKALLREPRLLVLDEPTAVLAPAEVDRLFDILRGLARDGTGIAVVAHKLDEVLAIADRVTVLRRGATVLEAARSDVDANVLAQAMIGESASDLLSPGESETAGLRAESVAVAPEAPAPGGEAVVVRAGGVTVQDSGDRALLNDVSLQVSRGEVVGIAGIEGNGQRELALVLAGRVSVESGSLDLPAGVGFIPQDRTSEGLALPMDLVENIALAVQRDPAFRRGPFLDWDAIHARAEEIRDRFSVASDGVDTSAASLSGGNQQRVVVGRELRMASDLLVAENPTRGLDVAATAFVHSEIRSLVRGPRPPGVVLISTDLDEVLTLADRLFVLARGRLVSIPDSDRTREAVGQAMLLGAGAAS